jgi:hypothetical protein
MRSRTDIVDQIPEFADKTGLASNWHADGETLLAAAICSVNEQDRRVAEMLEPQFQELQRTTESREGPGHTDEE